MMRTDSIVRLINQLIDCFPSHKNLTLLWHGGEPLLWGIQNFRKIFEYTEAIKSTLTIRHSIQTNLSLITDDYISLFKEYNVRVGFSFDGMKDINDLQRKSIHGKGTFDLILEKLALCRKQGVRPGAIIVATKNFKGRIKELYDFLCLHELNFKFNPLFAAGEASALDSLAITPAEYAEMAIELFDLWFYDKYHSLKESTFIDIASYFLSKKKIARSCMLGQNCQRNFIAISPRGDVFPCGRFCETDATFSFGNINRLPLKDILQKRFDSQMFKREKYIEQGNCVKCSYYGLCHGGCLHDGFLVNHDFKTKTFLCHAYKLIFGHIERSLKESNLI